MDYLLTNRLTFILLLISAIGRAESLSREDDSWQEFVYPVQFRNGEMHPDLDTRDYKAKQKGTHFHVTNIEMNMLGKKHRIKLELNRDLLSNGLKLKHDQNEQVQVVEEMTIENCYYQGQVRRISDSLVAVSTCHGIRGVIVLGHAVYIIEPVSAVQNVSESRYPHVLRRAQPNHQTTCANDRGMWSSYKDLHHSEFLRNLKFMKLDVNNSILSETKYIRIALAIDHTLYSRLNGSLNDAVHYVALLSNVADTMLNSARVNIRIKLGCIEIWNRRDHIHIPVSARGALTAFLQYWKESITQVHIHFAQLITGRLFVNDELGMAVTDSICTDRAVAVSKVDSVSDMWQAAFGVVHLVGHVLGVSHDTPELCSCDDQAGCLMGQRTSGLLSTHAHSWSSCNIKDIHTAILSRLANCLLSSSISSEVTFEQRCGNGIVERGEECDCQNEEECELTDACCDARTCLLKPWATCQSGDCCYNCTVRPSYQMCRDGQSECDVPEFCDGISGHCPLNALTQDGQSCSDGQGYCYRGVCQTYTQQCQALWGPASSVADNQCYDTFNTAGRFNGHCGFNITSGDYIKCSVENTKCGLLHCSGGFDKPLIAHNQTFSKTLVYSDNREYECKIVNGQPESGSSLSRNDLLVGMVYDGSQCGSDFVCIGSACVPLSYVMPVTCVTGPNGIVCSGHGVCTTDVRCFCFAGYTGIDCSTRTNVTRIPLLMTTTTTLATFVTLHNESFLVANFTLSTTPNTTSSMPDVFVDAGISHVDSSATWWLVFVLVGVIISAIVVLAVCLLCYRRQSPLISKDARKKPKRKTFGSVTSFSSHKSNDSACEPAANRIISFGKMPSYKEEKLKRAMRHYQQQRQQRSSAASETASDRSRTDRDSVELKALTMPLPAAPERGILKKCASHNSKCAHANMSSPDMMDKDNYENQRRSLLTDNVSLAIPEASGVEYIDDDEDCSNCSCDEDQLSVASHDDELKPRVSSPVSDGCSRETQTDPESRGSSVTSVFDSDYKIGIVCELLQQIDEQFDSVIHAVSQPSKCDGHLSHDATCNQPPGSAHVAISPVVEHLDVPSLGTMSGIQPVDRLSTATSSLPTDARRPVAVRSSLLSSSPATVASEGYQSDKVGTVEPEVPTVVREIPINSLRSQPRCSSPAQLRKCLGILKCPEDIDV